VQWMRYRKPRDKRNVLLEAERPSYSYIVDVCNPIDAVVMSYSDLLLDAPSPRPSRTRRRLHTSKTPPLVVKQSKIPYQRRTMDTRRQEATYCLVKWRVHIMEWNVIQLRVDYAGSRHSNWARRIKLTLDTGTRVGSKSSVLFSQR
jgi:hypothetical protein